MAGHKHKIPKRNWAIFTPTLKFTIKRATDEGEAKLMLLRDYGCESKPYLARDWIVREATEEEIHRYAGQADNLRPSQTPERQAIEARRSGRDRRMSVQERLI